MTQITSGFEVNIYIKYTHIDIYPLPKVCAE